MKYILFVLLVSLLIISCKDETTNSPISNYTFKGRILLSDSISEPVTDNSNIKVTVLESGMTTTTDSTGHFTFTNITSGIYSFSFEYKNYPKLYKYDLAINSSNSSTISDEYLGYLSPLPVHTFILDSITYGSITYANLKMDSIAYVNYRRLSPVLTHYFNQLVIISKSKSNLDYQQGKYLIARAWIGVSIYSKIVDTLYSSFNYDSLKSWGFNNGDSVCFKYYPLNSVSSYIDKNTQKYIYPYIGASSNILSMKLK